MKVRKKNPPMDLKSHATAFRVLSESLSQAAPKLAQLPIPSAQTRTDTKERAITPGLVCHMEEAISRSRQLLQDTETLCQERRAARKSQAELQDSPLRKRAS
jgi:hypothetical protein